MKKLYTIVLFCLFTPVFGQIPSSGLVAYFPFTGNANDSSGNATHGTKNNVTLAMDRFGDSNAAYSFSGNSNSYISFPSTNVVNNTYSYSIWLNVKTLPSSGSLAAMLEIGQGGGGTGQQMFIHNNYLGTYTGLQVGGYNQSTPHFGLVTKTLPSTNKWYHLVNVRNTNYILLYVDGKLIDSQGVSSTILPAYGSPVKAYIGVRCNNTDPYTGLIDEVCIYNRPISAAEVKQLYLNNTPSKVDFADNASGVSLYPNPAAGQINLAFKGPHSDNITIRIFDLMGKLIYENKTTPSDEIRLNVSDFSPGTYVVKVEDKLGRSILNEKIILHNP